MTPDLGCERCHTSASYQHTCQPVRLAALPAGRRWQAATAVRAAVPVQQQLQGRQLQQQLLHPVTAVTPGQLRAIQLPVPQLRCPRGRALLWALRRWARPLALLPLAPLLLLGLPARSLCAFKEQQISLTALWCALTKRTLVLSRQCMHAGT